MTTEQQVAKHYSSGKLEQNLLAALTAAGKDIDKLKSEDLSGVDEMHLGGRLATIELAKDLGLVKDMQMLDVGSGLGGPARYFAEFRGCRVTGIDLTEEFVAVAKMITRRCGLGERATFKQASALDLPFADASFDAATMIHVGMNISDKAKVFGEVRRVVKKGGRFGVYDIMGMGAGELPFPMPWAAGSATSFVEPPETYRTLLKQAGFTLEAEHNRREFCMNIFKEMRERMAKEGPSPLGAHIIMGDGAKERLDNVKNVLEKGAIAPIAMIARAA
jgi:ubiquinone/menaquinone biosynthesis C-methylase UbiE